MVAREQEFINNRIIKKNLIKNANIFIFRYEFKNKNSIFIVKISR